VIVTAPQRQWPVIAEPQWLAREASGSEVAGCILIALEVNGGKQPARRGQPVPATAIRYEGKWRR